LIAQLIDQVVQHYAGTAAQGAGTAALTLCGGACAADDGMQGRTCGFGFQLIGNTLDLFGGQALEIADRRALKQLGSAPRDIASSRTADRGNQRAPQPTHLPGGIALDEVLKLSDSCWVALFSRLGVLLGQLLLGISRDERALLQEGAHVPHELLGDRKARFDCLAIEDRFEGVTAVTLGGDVAIELGNGLLSSLPSERLLLRLVGDGDSATTDTARRRALVLAAGT